MEMVILFAYACALGKKMFEPLLMLHMVTAGNGNSVMDVLFAPIVTITGVADHFSYTFDM